MKKRFGRKFLACLLTLSLAVSLTAPALAYDTIAENPPKSLELPNAEGRMITYEDIDGGRVNSRTDTSDELTLYMNALTLNRSPSGPLLKTWLSLAYNIFETQPEASTDHAGDGWDKDYGKGHYMDFISDMQRESYERDAYSGLSSTGLCEAESLVQVQERAADSIADLIDHKLKGSSYLSRHPMPDLEKATSDSPVLYTTVTCFDRKGAEYRYYYDSYTVAFYDFQLHILSDDAELSGRVVSNVSDPAPSVSTVSFSQNLGMEYDNRDTTLAISSTQTASTSITNSESYSFGQEVGGSFSLERKLGKKNTATFEVNTNLSFNEAMETAYGEESSVSETVDHSVTENHPVPPHTYDVGTQEYYTASLTTEFDCPVGLSYKVAIFAMSGSVYDDNAAVQNFKSYSQRSFLTFFGQEPEAPDAVESLYQRAVQYRDIPSYEQTHGGTTCVNRDGDPVGAQTLNWEDIYNAGTPNTNGSSVYTISAAIDNLSTTYPMTYTGARITITQETTNTKSMPSVPIYPIGSVVVNLQLNRSIDLEVGETFPMNSYRVKAYDTQSVEYYGFVATAGQWRIVDAQGKETTSSVAEMRYDPVTKEQLLVAKAPGVIYVKYFIPEDTYVTYDGVVSTNDNIDSAAYRVEVSAPPVEPPPAFEGTIQLTGSVTTTVGETINLNAEEGLDVFVLDPTGMEIRADVLWQSQELPERGIQVEENGALTTTQAGTFHVRAKCDDVYSNWATVTAVEPQEPVVQTKDHTFADVDYDDWHNDAVGFVFQNGLMKGNGNGTFGPDDIITRGMMVQTLANNEGFVQAAANAFADVDPEDWYAKAVNWAAANGIAVGEYGKFLPDEPLAREALATFLVRWLDWKGYALPEGDGTLADYPDGDQVSDWAKPSVERLVAAGVLGGHDDGTLDPRGSATRAEYAALLQRTLEQVI